MLRLCRSLRRNISNIHIPPPTNTKRTHATYHQPIIHPKKHAYKQLYHQKHSQYSSKNETFLSGNISQYSDALFEQWQTDASSVDESWNKYFTNLYKNIDQPSSKTTKEISRMITDATNLLKYVRCYQSYGHFVAKLDPLKILNQGIDRKQFVPELLKKEHWGFTDDDLDREIYVGEHQQFLDLMNVDSPIVTLRNVEHRLKDVYCNEVGYQFMHIANYTKNQFLRKKIENNIDISVKTNEEKLRIFDRLLWAEEFENFLDVKYPAQKRFGINGAESFVPLLKEIIDEGARLGVKDFVIGMPHRGRLLFLATVLRKPLEHIFYEFRGLAVPMFESGDSGDVKYHLGSSVDRLTPNELEVHLSLFPNPSHLEAVDPVIMGKTRAKQYFNGDTQRNKTCAIIIHGDASFSGQGVVYESMSLTDLTHYTTGGVIHVIVNNQIGFTTDAYDSRSSPYCTDVGRSVAAPIFHINGDNPEAVVECARLAIQYRQEFNCDAILDMICFRRYGHNEGDEPMFTQPLMYSVINDKMKRNDTVMNNYGQKLLADGVIDEDGILQMRERIKQILSESYDKSSSITSDMLVADWLGDNWSDIKSRHDIVHDIYDTCITKERAEYICDVMTSFPSDLILHRNLIKIMSKRRNSVLVDKKDIDWGTAEHLAYGSILMDGFHVRLSGQDSERGTFSHRHAVIHCQSHDDIRQERKKYIPLCSLVDPITGVEVGERFHVSNSNLSEFGVLGFEYGYSCESPQSLVLWEAQFGDFANGAQVIFDQFISSGEAKWLRQSGLVILLPHGYEGGGPEHSSSRIERYLQMCNDDEDVFVDNAFQQLLDINWQIVNCTTPANFFHVIRRQVSREFRKPLIVATPKYGLRHHLATSSLDEFVECGNGFRTIICDDEEYGTDGERSGVRRIVFCSGKIWINLCEYRIKQIEIMEGNAKELANMKNVLLIRIEQISPFPFNLIAEQMKKYVNAEMVYCQEEPKNMGSYNYISRRLFTTLKYIGRDGHVRYIGRSSSASPATGYPQVHRREMGEILSAAFQ